MAQCPAISLGAAAMLAQLINIRYIEITDISRLHSSCFADVFCTRELSRITH